MRVAYSQINPPEISSSSQIKIDTLCFGLSEQSTCARNILAMTAGSFTFSALRWGGNSLLSFLPASRLLSWCTALVGEVAVFRGINEGRNWKEKNDFVHTLLDFACLKGMSSFLITEGFVTRHMSSAFGMVAGGYLGESLGLSLTSQSIFSERLANAFCASMSLEAGAKLFAVASGRVMERFMLGAEQSRSIDLANKEIPTSRMTLAMRRVGWNYKEITAEELYALGEYPYEADHLSDNSNFKGGAIHYQEGMVRLDGVVGIVGLMHAAEHTGKTIYERLVDSGEWKIFEELGFRVNGSAIFVPSVNSLNRRMAELKYAFRYRPVYGLASAFTQMEGLKKSPAETALSLKGLGYAGQSYFNHDLFYHLPRYKTLLELDWTAYRFLSSRVTELLNSVSPDHARALKNKNSENSWVAIVPDFFDRAIQVEEALYEKIRAKMLASPTSIAAGITAEYWRELMGNFFPEKTDTLDPVEQWQADHKFFSEDHESEMNSVIPLTEEEVRTMPDFRYSAKEMSSLQGHRMGALCFEEGMVRMGNLRGIVGRRMLSGEGSKSDVSGSLDWEAQYRTARAADLGVRVLGRDKIFVPSDRTMNRRLQERNYPLRVRVTLCDITAIKIVLGFSESPHEVYIGARGDLRGFEAMFHHDLSHLLEQYMNRSRNDWWALHFLAKRYLQERKGWNDDYVDEVLESALAGLLDSNLNLPEIAAFIRSNIQTENLAYDESRDLRDIIEEFFPFAWTDPLEFGRVLREDLRARNELAAD